MKVSATLICIAVLLSALQVADARETPAAVQLSQMMKRMYSYSVNEFDYGRNPVTHEYDAVRNCTILRTFFDMPMLRVPHGAAKCRFDHSRFAPDSNGTPMEEVVTADHMNLPPPVPFIQGIKVNGDLAQIDILFGDADAPKGRVPDAGQNKGRVVFFLRQLAPGWRIVNKLSFKVWPLSLDGENSDCRMASVKYEFALEPRTEAELMPLPPACQKLARPHLSK